jgi:hypothetical protein
MVEGPAQNRRDFTSNFKEVIVFNKRLNFITLEAVS